MSHRDIEPSVSKATQILPLRPPPPGSPSQGMGWAHARNLGVTFGHFSFPHLSQAVNDQVLTDLILIDFLDPPSSTLHCLQTSLQTPSVAPFLTATGNVFNTNWILADGSSPTLQWFPFVFRIKSKAFHMVLKPSTHVSFSTSHLIPATGGVPSYPRAFKPAVSTATSALPSLCCQTYYSLFF